MNVGSPGYGKRRSGSSPNDDLEVDIIANDDDDGPPALGRHKRRPPLRPALADIAITAASQHGCRITHTEHPASSNVNPYHDHPSPNVHTPTSFTILLAAPRTHQIYTTDHAVLALGSTKASESAPPYDATILRGRPPQMLSTTPNTTAVSKKHPRLHETDRADAPANPHGQPHTPHLTPTVGPQP